MMLPPTQLRDGRTYGSENLRSAMQKDFFDSIGPNAKSAAALRLSAYWGRPEVAD
jgi:hypothetical protein